MAPSTPLPVYYNENDAFCASWLANLISAGHLPRGDIDTRDIRDVTPNDLRPYRQCHFFAGIGGWPLALRRAAIPVDVPLWTGSCPCQPFSQAGRRGGFADERHLWPSWHWLIEQCRPATILGEQVASASDWLGLVRGDLEALDYAVGAMPVEAASAGADHRRDRYWFVAHQQSERWNGRQIAAGTNGWISAQASGLVDADESCTGQEWQQRSGEFSRISGDQETCNGGVGYTAQLYSHVSNIYTGSDNESQEWSTLSKSGNTSTNQFEWVLGADGKARRVKPGVRLLVDGFPNRVGLLRGFGNAIDPRPAQAFIEAAFEAIDAAAR